MQIVEFLTDCTVAVDNAGFKNEFFETGDVVKLADPVSESVINGGLAEKYARKVGRPSKSDSELWEEKPSNVVLFNTKEQPGDKDPTDPPETTDIKKGEIEHKGKGFYELPGGERIRGKNAAQNKLNALHDQAVADQKSKDADKTGDE